MRPLLPILIVLTAATAVRAAPLTVPVDQTRRLAFTGSASSVSVGNKDIADVKAVGDSHTLMVYGKKPGVTNVVVFDAAGHTLYDDEIQVSPAPGAVVTIYRGTTSSDYACAPYCQSVQPGGLMGALASIMDMAAKNAPAATAAGQAAASAPAAPVVSTPSSGSVPAPR